MYSVYAVLLQALIQLSKGQKVKIFILSSPFQFYKLNLTSPT